MVSGFAGAAEGGSLSTAAGIVMAIWLVELSRSLPARPVSDGCALSFKGAGEEEEVGGGGGRGGVVLASPLAAFIALPHCGQKADCARTATPQSGQRRSISGSIKA